MRRQDEVVNLYMVREEAEGPERHGVSRLEVVWEKGVISMG